MPPQIHGNESKKNLPSDIQAAADTFIQSVKTEENLNLEFIDFDVHGSHILKVNSGDGQIHIVVCPGIAHTRLPCLGHADIIVPPVGVSLRCAKSSWFLL